MTGVGRGMENKSFNEIYHLIIFPQNKGEYSSFRELMEIISNTYRNYTTVEIMRNYY